MSGRSANAVPSCENVDISVPTDILDLDYEVQRCYVQCMSEQQYADFDSLPDGVVSMVIGCAPKNCATIRYAKNAAGEMEAASDYEYSYAWSVAGYCTRERLDEIDAEGTKSLQGGATSFSFCCAPEGPKKPNLVGPIVGGVVGGAAILACAGVLVWMIVAKKGCFAPRVGQKTTVEVPENAGRPVVVSASQ